MAASLSGWGHRIGTSPRRCYHGERRIELAGDAELQGEIRAAAEDGWYNVSDSVLAKVGVGLHRQAKHPIHTLRARVQSFFDASTPPSDPRVIEPWPATWEMLDDLSPVASTEDCFDRLLTPPDHVSRQRSDTYYITKDTVLRAHTSTHQFSLMAEGRDAFLVAGDVYRRDEVDASHYPVFHQMEGVRIWPTEAITDEVARRADCSTEAVTEAQRTALVAGDLQATLEGMVRHVFGADLEVRWVDAYFPFTVPSFELEILFNSNWLETLGCGVVHPTLMANARAAGGLDDGIGWAFGLGLDRLAMVLFDVPDVRLFWTSDARFHDQFQSGEIVQFKPFSKFPPCTKDITFWTDGGSGTGSGDGGAFHENDFYEAVRNIAGDLVEDIRVIDEFVHPTTKRTSKCFRIIYRSLERTLTNEEVDELQWRVRDHVSGVMGHDLR